MPQRIVGLLLACALVLCGGATLAAPAVASPQSSASAKAAKAVKAHQAKVKAAEARAAAAARARAKALAEAGPRAAAAAKAASAARVRANAATKAAALAQAKARVAARAAVVAQARSAAVAKTKASAAAKKKAAQAAAAAAKAAAQSKAQARAKSLAATRARAAAATAARVSADARINNVAQAQPRAEAAARKAAVARTRVVSAKAKVVAARISAAAAARAAAAAQASAAAVADSKASAKVKKKAAKAAKAAVRAAAKAQTRVRAAAVKAAKAKAAAKTAAKAAKRAKAAAGPNPLWAPTDSLVFNNPKGTKQQQLAIITQLNQAIDATPAGGEIRMAMYLFDIKSVADKLNAATRRGVSVQILIDDGEANQYISKVRKTLGTNKKARSFVATCKRGCMSNGPSVIHAKFYLFSVAGQKRYVSMISSANPYTGNTFNSWNNNHTIVGNRTIYNSLSKYFTDMLADKQNLNYFRVTTSGKYTIYLYPQQVRRPQDVVLLNVLNHTTCAKTKPGYGSKGKTLVRVANWGWTGARMDIALRLWKLQDSGCRVQVMVNKGRISRGILKVLLKPSKKYGQMHVYDAWYDPNNNDVAGLYLHHKMVTINGLLGGVNVKTTWTGSQNFTSLATIANNDMILRVVDPAVTNAYNRNFAYIRDHYTRRLKSVPWITRPVPE